MYYNDHNPPHFHARYGQAQAVVSISDGSVLAGELPPTAWKIVSVWALAHRAELEQNWARGRQQFPFEKIAGPDHD